MHRKSNAYSPRFENKYEKTTDNWKHGVMNVNIFFLAKRRIKLNFSSLLNIWDSKLRELLARTYKHPRDHGIE